MSESQMIGIVIAKGLGQMILIMKKINLLLFGFLLFSNAVLAQRYGTAVGIRLGNNDIGRTFGISAQQRIMDHVTVEGILQSDFNLNTNLSFLLEKHHPVISKRFNYYYGAGISFGKEASFYKDEVNKELVQTYGNATFGVDLIGGIELTVANAVISLDYKPNVNLAGRSEFYRGQVGVSARMVLVKSKEQKKKQRQRQREKDKKESTSINSKLDDLFGKKN